MKITIDLGEFRLFEIIKQGGVADDVCEKDKVGGVDGSN